MKKTLLLWLFGLLLTAQVFAQNRSLSGTVKDATTGEALIGVNVTGKGTTIGTVTDIDGKYTLELPKDVSALVFSYVGYTNIEKTILSLKTDVAMAAEGQKLEDVVVTAVAIKREKRSTSFANQTVTADDLDKVPNKSALNALQGKVAGVKISSGSGAMGASTRIVLRGETSITGGNNALIVVDGMPINNSQISAAQNNGTSFIDFGNRGNDINPDDIESISILKGAAATALYGSRANGGVVLITTKSGKQAAKNGKGAKVSIGTSVTFDKVYNMLKKQELYGEGYDVTGDGRGDFVYGENFSWGPKLDGVDRSYGAPVIINGEEYNVVRPFSAVKNQMSKFYDLGITNKNNISIQGGNDKFNYYTAVTNVNNKGIMPYNYFRKNSVTLNANANFNEKLSSSFNFQYVNTNQKQQKSGTEFSNPITAFIQTPANINPKELRDFNNPFFGFPGYYGSYTTNPYYLLSEENNINKTDNIIGQVSLSYKPVSDLELTARVGDNINFSTTTSSLPVFSYIDNPYDEVGPTSSNPLGLRDNDFGGFQIDNYKTNTLNLDLFANYKKEFKKKYSISLIGGYNFFNSKTQDLFSETVGGLIIPNFYNLSNGAGTPSNRTTNSITNRSLIGLYANAVFSFKNMLFLEYSCRNDWSSTLPKGNRGFFYQAGGVSFVPTELLKEQNKWINYIKIRANVGSQGKDAGLYALESTYSSNPRYLDYIDSRYAYLQFPFRGVPAFTKGNVIGNPNLKPEFTVNYEAGVDVEALDNHLNLSFTFYKNINKNLIVDVDLPKSSGFISQSMNIGRMDNTGYELTAKISPIKNLKKINWDLNFVFAKNNNIVKKVAEGLDEVNMGTYITPAVVAKVGYPLGTFKVDDYQRDSLGRIMIDPSKGLPIKSSEYSYVGNYQPKYTLGLGTQFSWNGLSFGILFDLKKGGVFYSNTKSSSEFNGSSISTLWNNREPLVMPNTSYIDPITKGVVANTSVYTYVDQEYYANMPDVDNMIDASYIKLREVSLSYSLPKKSLINTPISNITFSLIGRNLKVWVPKSNTFTDPEVSSFGATGNEQGFDWTSTPYTRSAGFDVKIEF